MRRVRLDLADARGLARTDSFWALPPRLRRRTGKTDSNPARSLTGLGLGAKGGGDIVFFLINKKSRKHAEAHRQSREPRVWLEPDADTEQQRL